MWLIAFAKAVVGSRDRYDRPAVNPAPEPSWPLGEAVRRSLPPLDRQYEYGQDLTFADGTPGLVLGDRDGLVTVFVFPAYNLDCQPEAVVVLDHRSLIGMLVCPN